MADTGKSIASFTLSQLDMDYVEELFATTKEVYNNLPEEIKNEPFSDEFRNEFISRLDARYLDARQILSDCRENTDISNIYLCFYDHENIRLVLVLDGDTPDNFYLPGQYISDTGGNLESWKQIEKNLNSDWYLTIAYSELVGYAATDYIPLYAKDGSMIGMIAMDITLTGLIDEILMFFVFFFPVVVIMFLILYFFISRSIDKKLVAPIKSLAEAAKTYTNSDMVNAAEKTNIFKNVDISSAEELVELRDTMSYMEDGIYNSMKQIRRVSAEKERMAAELDIAAAIQQSSLPTDYPCEKSFDLYASMHPAREIGGDFYDFFMISDDQLAMVIADVAGKGIPAALFMMKVKELLKNRAIWGGTPSGILEYVNKELCKNNEGMMFVTIWFGILDISTGIITASNAGHEYPFVSDSEGNFSLYNDPHGVVCGAIKDSKYEDYTLSLPKKGGLFLYTDGVPEAENQKEDSFTLSRIEKSLNEHKKMASKELIYAVNKDLDSFTAGREQFDDVTMMCLFLR